MSRISHVVSSAVAAGAIAISGLGVPQALAAVPVNPAVIGDQCFVEGQAGQQLTITESEFQVEGTNTVRNDSDEDLPLTQTIREGSNKSWNVGGSVNFDLLELFNVTFSSSYSSTQTWEVGQTLGPYPVHPGKTGVLEYGFLNQRFEGKNLRCTGGQWVDTGRDFYGMIPKERHIKVSMRDND